MTNSRRAYSFLKFGFRSYELIKKAGFEVFENIQVNSNEQDQNKQFFGLFSFKRSTQLNFITRMKTALKEKALCKTETDFIDAPFQISKCFRRTIDQ